MKIFAELAPLHCRLWGALVRILRISLHTGMVWVERWDLKSSLAGLLTSAPEGPVSPWLLIFKVHFIKLQFYPCLFAVNACFGVASHGFLSLGIKGQIFFDLNPINHFNRDISSAQFCNIFL